MMFSITPSLTVLMVVVLAGAPAFAAGGRKTVPLNPSNTAGSSLPLEATSPLRGNIRLDTGVFARLGVPALAKVDSNELSQKFSSFSSLANEWERDAKQLLAFEKSCSSPSKSYSVQDQMAAGCTGSDTLSQCMNKLYKQCVRESFDTHIFLSRAQMTSGEARNMSQLLIQYANDLETYSKQLDPEWLAQ